ncbi:glycosyltransferase [Paludisphaera mucosa]|uniref:Glycosyltransferase n=1 Tax=Paludisphaera mucosa TaxID=3030827 RepID=A0ABT6F9L8_9BACT|nr:glycosyltransferase [Paludisphaera mucosa]MDG3004250.1 glycosyltransferase [Paludisphaera mucosa]
MDRPAPRLTVAIPTYNGEAHLAEALAGILAQERAAFDLLVCDERSDDRTLEIVRALAGDRARIEVNSERLGLAGNWNRCVALSRTPWVAVFHQDDLMRPGDLAGRLEAIERPGGDDLGLIAGPADVVDQEGRPVPPTVVKPGGLSDPVPGRFLDFPPGGFSPRLEGSNILRCSAVTTSKRAHEEVGGFDPTYRYVVDWDFWLRVADRFGVAWIAGEPKVSVRWHAASETHRFKLGLDDLEETERLLTRRDQRPGRRLARAYLNRAHDALRAGRADLARTALGRSVHLSPAILTTILADPRLAAQMTALTFAPSLARRWFAR